MSCGDEHSVFQKVAYETPEKTEVFRNACKIITGRCSQTNDLRTEGWEYLNENVCSGILKLQFINSMVSCKRDRYYVYKST